MARLIDDFERLHPAAVVRRGSETFIRASAAVQLVELAAERNVRVLGVDGFLVSDDAVYPALSRVADYSALDGDQGASTARALLTHEWAEAPTQDDQMHREAGGEYMVIVEIEDR